MHQFLKFILGMKLYTFRTVPLSIVSFSLYTEQWYMSYRFADSLLLASCQQTCMTYTTAVYSEKLLTMDRGTVRNVQSFIPRINLRNQCIQLVLFNTMHGHMNVKYYYYFYYYFYYYYYYYFYYYYYYCLCVFYLGT